MSDDVSLGIRRLIEYKPSLQQLLMACPYDQYHSIDGLVTREIFLARLFHCDDALVALKEELARRATSKIETNRILLVTGYNGIGKSTFLWYFIDENSNFDHHYLNFHSSAGDESPEEPVTKVFRNQVVNMDVADQVRCIRLIKNNATRLGEVFSPGFLRCVRNVEASAITEEFIQDRIEHAQTGDILLLYFMMLFLRPTSKDLRIIYLDNLDAVGVDYLSDSFRIAFRNALIRATKLSLMRAMFPDPVLFAKKYRFVFCLRDASSAIFNAHIEDSLGSTIKCIPYRVRFPSEFYRAIIRKRLDLIAEILGDDPDIRSVSDAILEFIGDMAFFEPALVNLFNSDYRRLAYALLQIANETGVTVVLDRQSRYYEYGMRGALMHGVVRFLREGGYLKDHVETQFDPDREKHGYFHHTRMVLNIILNNSQGNIREQTLDPSRLTGYCSLYDLARNLKGVYPYSEILQTVAECFLYHKKSWVQLLSIYNKPVRRVDAFDEEERLLRDLDSVMDEDSFELDEDAKKRRDEIINRLSRIIIKINPAGISYLKYVITHFEYYSIFALPNNPSLFQVDPRSLAREGTRGQGARYVFENIIDAVYKRFELHFRMMRKFYFRVFEGELGHSPTTFRLSKFSFKFIGDSARPLGMFHSSRVIYSHIDYLDHYRLHAIQNPRLDSDEIWLINQRLVTRIERYVHILRRSYDDSTQDACDVFGKQISKIKESDYADTKTRIELHHT